MVDNTKASDGKFMTTLKKLASDMSVKDRVLWILQSVISCAILIIAILGLIKVMSISISNSIDMVLLFFLFIICGLKYIPGRFLYATINFIIALLICGIYVASFFI